jgi:hypothetical protein
MAHTHNDLIIIPCSYCTEATERKIANVEDEGARGSLCLILPPCTQPKALVASEDLEALTIPSFIRTDWPEKLEATLEQYGARGT